MKSKKSCPDCGAPPGQFHRSRCDVEQCPLCCGQLLSCGCKVGGTPRLPWAGEWRGVAECVEFGWYARLQDGYGWVSCSAKDKGAVPDLNRLMADAIWDRQLRRFVLKRKGIGKQAVLQTAAIHFSRLENK